MSLFLPFVCFQLLCDFGADANKKNGEGKSALELDEAKNSASLQKVSSHV